MCPINCRNFTWILLRYTFWEKKCIIILCQWLKVIYSALSKKIYYIHLFLCTLHDVFFVVLYFLSLPIKCPNIMTKRQRIKWQEEKIIIFGSFFKRKIIYMKKHIEEYFFSIQDLRNPFLFKVISFHRYEVLSFLMIAIRVDIWYKYLVRMIIELSRTTAKCSYISDKFFGPNSTNVTWASCIQIYIILNTLC